MALQHNLRNVSVCSAPAPSELLRRPSALLRSALFRALLLPACAFARGTVELTGYTTGQFRWKDIAGNIYAADYRDSYSYTGASVVITYSTNATILAGTMVATNLKPNFAYQFKLIGLPETDSTANEDLGFSGRWWKQEWEGTNWSEGWNLNHKGDGSFPNSNDLWYIDHKHDVNTNSPTGKQYRFTGYRPFDYFITDSNGCATLAFSMVNAYHVLYGSWQGSPGPNDGPMKWHSFDPDPAVQDAYDTDHSAATVGVYAEWERLPKDEIFIAPGDYTLDFLITEESFHESGIGGWWAHMGHGRAQFRIVLPRIHTAVEPAPAGSITPDGTFEIACGGSTNLSFGPVDYWEITNVVVNGTYVGITSSWEFLQVTNDQWLTVYLAPQLASNDVPKWWLAEHGWTNDFDVAATNDQDDDGMITSDEWRADTVPTNAESVLAITGIVLTNGGVRVYWQGGVGSTQFLQYRENLCDTQDSWRTIFTNPPPTATTTNVMDTGATDGVRFYRIKAER